MRIFVIIVCLLICRLANGQEQSNDTRTKLEEHRKEILKEIQDTEKELVELRSSKKVTLNQLRVLQDKEDERKKLIENITQEVSYINTVIQSYLKQISALQRNLERYKLMYSKSIRYSFKSRNTYGMLAYLCSSADFNDAVRRMRYLRLFRALRKQQAEKIRNTHAAIFHKIDLLNAEKDSKNKLLAELSTQNTTLIAESEETNVAIKDLLSREKELQEELQAKKKSAKRITDAIQAIIRREMSHSEEAAGGGNYPTDEVDNADTKEDEIPAISKAELGLAKNFEKSKGKLLFPVEKGKINCHFGRYNIKNISYYNNGIDIQTVSYGIVLSVFEGTVSSVVNMDGKLIIIVQHGNYFTVYNNLIKSLTLKGQHVSAKQPLGLVANNDDGMPVLNFQIWKSGGSNHATTMLNPESWLDLGKLK